MEAPTIDGAKSWTSIIHNHIHQKWKFCFCASMHATVGMSCHLSRTSPWAECGHCAPTRCTYDSGGTIGSLSQINAALAQLKTSSHLRRKPALPGSQVAASLS